MYYNRWWNIEISIRKTSVSNSFLVSRTGKKFPREARRCFWGKTVRGFLDFAPKTTLFGPSSLFGSHILSKNYDNSIQLIMTFPLMNSPCSSFFGYFRTRILDFRTVLAHFWRVLGVRVVHLNEEIRYIHVYKGAIILKKF